MRFVFNWSSCGFILLGAYLVCIEFALSRPAIDAHLLFAVLFMTTGILVGFLLAFRLNYLMLGADLTAVACLAAAAWLFNQLPQAIPLNVICCLLALLALGGAIGQSKVLMAGWLEKNTA